MGAAISSTNNNNTSVEEQPGPEDDEFCCRNKDYTTDAQLQNLHYEQDGQIVQRGIPNLITDEVIRKLETQLDFSEKVSLIYLLYDDPTITFEGLLNYLECRQKMVLLEWWQTHLETDNWQRKLCEGLALIQNYQILSQLGYERSQVEEFLIFNENTSVINSIKRNLYRVCESLNNDQVNKVLAKVKRHFFMINIEFKEFVENNLEFYFAYWTVIKYISFTDLNNLHRTLNAIKDPHLTYLALNLKQSPPIVNNEFFTTKRKLQEDKCYQIDSKSPGICLIINQEHFYTEPTKSLESRLPADHELRTLGVRKGTERDRNRLQDTFTKFGFSVIIRNNRTHDQMEDDIKNAAKDATNHSSLVICILSHGIEGATYAANSIRVEIRDICNLMCNTNPNMKDKPKILILQSCQGAKLYQLTTDCDGENDELIHNDMYGCSLLQDRDMMVFRATVPGYASLRCEVEGTWFIQCLCDTILEEARREHFLDICVSVQNEMSNKSCLTRKGDLIGMVPVIETTLRKKLYLPLLKNT